MALVADRWRWKSRTDLVVEEFGQAEVAHLLGEDVLVEHLLLHEVAGGDGHVEDGHAGRVALDGVDPALADVVRDVRAVAAGEAEARAQVESGHRRRRYEPLHVHVVLERELDDGVTGASGLNLDRPPGVRNVHKLRRGQVVLRDVNRALELRVGRGFDVQRQ